MSNQRESCCGPADQATTEPGKPAETTSRAGEPSVAVINARRQERGTSGLLQAVRRLFGRVPA